MTQDSNVATFTMVDSISGIIHCYMQSLVGFLLAFGKNMTNYVRNSLDLT